MSKSLQDCLSFIDQETCNAVTNGRINGSVFAAYVNQSAIIFSGFEAAITLLQVDALAREGDSVEHMDDRKREALLGMMRVVSEVMQNRAQHISDWAHDRLKADQEKGARHG